ERVAWSPYPYNPPDLNAWPFTIPAVAQIVTEGGLDIPPGVTFLVGENGSGKSTIVEALAAVYPRVGGSKITGPGPSDEDSALPRHLQAVTHRRASPAGFFLRAEAMHAYLSSEDDHPNHARRWNDQALQTQSHGESFLAVLRQRFAAVGVYFLD